MSVFENKKCNCAVRKINMDEAKTRWEICRRIYRLIPHKVIKKKLSYWSAPSVEWFQQEDMAEDRITVLPERKSFSSDLFPLLFSIPVHINQFSCPVIMGVPAFQSGKFEKESSSDSLQQTHPPLDRSDFNSSMKPHNSVLGEMWFPPFIYLFFCMFVFLFFYLCGIGNNEIQFLTPKKKKNGSNIFIFKKHKKTRFLNGKKWLILWRVIFINLKAIDLASALRALYIVCISIEKEGSASL